MRMWNHIWPYEISLSLLPLHLPLFLLFPPLLQLSLPLCRLFFFLSLPLPPSPPTPRLHPALSLCTEHPCLAEHVRWRLLFHSCLAHPPVMCVCVCEVCARVIAWVHDVCDNGATAACAECLGCAVSLLELNLEALPSFPPPPFLPLRPQVDRLFNLCWAKRTNFRSRCVCVCVRARGVRACARVWALQRDCVCA